MWGPVCGPYRRYCDEHLLVWRRRQGAPKWVPGQEEGGGRRRLASPSRSSWRSSWFSPRTVLQRFVEQNLETLSGVELVAVQRCAGACGRISHFLLGREGCHSFSSRICTLTQCDCSGCSHITVTLILKVNVHASGVFFC